MYRALSSPEFALPPAGVSSCLAGGLRHHPYGPNEFDCAGGNAQRNFCRCGIFRLADQRSGACQAKRQPVCEIPPKASLQESSLCMTKWYGDARWQHDVAGVSCFETDGTGWHRWLPRAVTVSRKGLAGGAVSLLSQICLRSEEIRPRGPRMKGAGAASLALARHSTTLKVGGLLTK